MQLYGKATEAATKIVAAFQTPGQLPQALAQVFIHRKDDVPCNRWSWSNQLLTAIHGHYDARGFRQWQEVGRFVKKGEKSFQILVPLMRKVDRENSAGETETRTVVYGFKAAAVFGLSQTDGEPLAQDTEAQRWIDDLPLVEVAREWGLKVSTYDGRRSQALGWYRPGREIAVGTENLSTWCHELVHAADDRLGSLSESSKWSREVVAELGGAILLLCLDQTREADLGGAWHYIANYARSAEIEPLAACEMVLKRTCNAVALILDTAERIASGGDVEAEVETVTA